MQEDTMKKPVSMGMVAGIAVVVVALLAFIGYKVFGASNPPPPTQAQAIEMNKHSSSQGEAYNQQIMNRPKDTGHGSSSYSQQYSQQMQQGMRR